MLAPASRAARRLWSGGALALALLPLAMALANKSSPALVGIAALLFLAGSVLDDRQAAVDGLVRPLRGPPGLAALAFLAWCLVSLVWSPFPALSLRVAAEFVPTLLAAYLLACLAPGRLPAWASGLAAALLAAAALYVLASLALELAPQRALGRRAVAPFVMNRPVLTILLIAGPLAAVLASCREPFGPTRPAVVTRGPAFQPPRDAERPALSPAHRLAAAALLGLSALAILRSVSGAAALGLAAGAAAAGLGWVVPRRAALAAVGTGLGLALALAPVEGDLLARFMPDAAHERLVQSSSRARVVIAQSFGAAVAAEPWRGAGYGTAGRFPDVPAAQALEPEMRHMLAVGHPHNSFLQVWAELGLVGAILAGALLFLSLRAVAALPGRVVPAALGLVAAAAAVAFVEHGAWQAWWTASLGAAITWLRAASLESRETA